LCKFNPLKIDVIRDELWINSYQEMMDLCTLEWEFFEEIDVGCSWPPMEEDYDEGTFNTLVYICDNPAFCLDEDEVKRSQIIIDKIELMNSLLESKLKIREKRKINLIKKIKRYKAELLLKFFNRYPNMPCFNFQRSILCFLVLLNGSYSLCSSFPVDIAIAVCSCSLACAYLCV
jgi:hypothetical protein